MKKFLLIATILCFGVLAAQNKQAVAPGFDESKALQEAKARGLSPVDYAGYVKHQYDLWVKNNGTLAVEKKKESTAKKTPNAVTSAVNIDFESGNYNGWLTTVGENTVSSYSPLSNLRPCIPGGIDSLPNAVCNGNDAERHGLMTALYNDPISGIPLSSPLGGNYVARVNRYCVMSEGSMLTQSFAVTAGQTVLNYAYAVVMEDGGHGQGDQPYFMVRVFDQNNMIIDSVFMEAANGTTPGFYPCMGGNGWTYYKPWTPVSVNLSPYLGQNVTVEVTAAACLYMGHSGYAYFDARMDSTSSVPNVWPGDANYDLTADLNDLFYIGWAYGATGTTRNAATINWQAEPSADWGQTTAYGTEFKHADCNGDGIIDANDTAAIVQNYGLQHAFKIGQSNNEPAALTSYRNLQITPSITTAGPNQSLTLGISLPANTVSLPDDLYGISFRLSVPSQYIAALNSTDFTNSFLGVKGSTMLTLSKAVIGQDHIDVSLVRNNQQNSTGSGNLVDLNLTTTNFSMNGAHTFGISHIKAVTYQGATLPIGSGTALVNFSNSTGFVKTNQTGIIVLPNPASDKIVLEGLNEKTAIEIINVVGQPVLKTIAENKKHIDISSLESGAYFIKLHGAQGAIVKRFIKE